MARAVAGTPTWISHGARDWVVSPENSRRMLQRMKDKIELTHFKGFRLLHTHLD